MTTFAERFVAELHNKPAPITSEDDLNPDDTIYSGGIEHIAENCNVDTVDFDNSLIDDSIPEVLQDGAGTYYFKDGSKAGVRYHYAGHWDAWVMKG